MNHQQLKEYTSKKWDEIKSLEQEYKRKITEIKDLESELSTISFKSQRKLDDIETAHTLYNKAI